MTRNRSFLWGAGLLLVLCSIASAQYAVTEYAGARTPYMIAAGPDGALWFADYYANAIGRITTAGVVTEFTAGMSVNAGPYGIAAGPDGNLWFTERGIHSGIGRITPAGVITEFSSGVTAGSQPYQIVAGPDGNLWFTEISSAQIGRITPAGVITEFATGIETGSQPYGIAAGPDGALWFTEKVGNRIGRITTAGAVTTYSTGLPAAAGLTAIAAGPDGALWFVEEDLSQIGRIATDGVITSYSGMKAGSWAIHIAAGPDGALWFTEEFGNRIGRITTAGVVTEYPVTTASADPYGIAAGPDGNLWFTENATGQIGRITGPQPRIATGGIANAGSFAVGPVAPGEIVSIFGTLLGPTAGATLALDSSGKVATSIGGVTVSIGGHLAPLTYVGATQINAIVPYEVAGSATAPVQVTYGGMTSNQPSLQIGSTAPGLFTMNGSGSGPGAILNADSSLNTQANPAAKGSTIQLFMTGEGATTPAQATGAVTPVTASYPYTPQPQSVPSVSIGGQNAKLEWCGEAPYTVAGLLQVNADIPAGAASGANSITVKIGDNTSQSGVTVWVK